jgi:hypothetical protein
MVNTRIYAWFVEDREALWLLNQLGNVLTVKEQAL